MQISVIAKKKVPSWSRLGVLAILAAGLFVTNSEDHFSQIVFARGHKPAPN
jgi:hypothetical protein